MASNCRENCLQNFIPFNVPVNPEKLKEMARKNLGETEERRTECLQQLRKLVKDHGVASITCDHFLLRFLRVKKFDVQRSFEAVRHYARQRANFGEHLSKLRPETVEKFLRLNVLGVLPFRDAQDRIILYQTRDVWDFTVFSSEEMATMIAVITNYIAEEEISQVNGIVILYHRDSYVSLSNLHYYLRNLKTMGSFVTATPLRTKCVHCIDEPAHVRYILRLMRPFVPKKLIDRVLLHGKSTDILYEHFSPEILPTEYLGAAGPVSNEHIIKTCTEYLQRMKDEQQYFVPGNSL